MSSSVRWNERELELHEPLAPDGPSGDAVAPARSIIRSAGVATDPVDARDVAGPGHGPVPDPSSGVPSDETPSEAATRAAAETAARFDENVPLR